MIDGVHFGGHLCVVALGIGIDGVYDRDSGEGLSPPLKSSTPHGARGSGLSRIRLSCRAVIENLTSNFTAVVITVLE